MKEYKINEFLSLKLEGGITQIYVKGKRFLQCKRLVLNISKKDVPIYDEINSIDEAADVYQKHLYQNKIVEGPLARDLHEDHEITPEQEFWGHCANLQTWYENDYDTRLLHSNLTFYLLKALVDAGDPIARRVFKNEVAERFESGSPNVIMFIINAKLLDYFTLEEKREVIRIQMPIVFKYAPELLDCFSLEEKKEFSQKNKVLIYEKFKNIDWRINRDNAFLFNLDLPKKIQDPCVKLFVGKLFDYLTLEEQKDIIQKNFQDIIFYIHKFSRNYRSPVPRWQFSKETYSYVYLVILRAIKGTPLMDDLVKNVAQYSLKAFTPMLKAIQELRKLDEDYWNDVFTSFLKLWGEKKEKQALTYVSKDTLAKLVSERTLEILTSSLESLSEEGVIEELKKDRYNKCGEALPPESLKILIVKKVVYCPYCGILNRKFKPSSLLQFIY